MNFELVPVKEEEKEILKTYIRCFRKLTDGGLWPVYQQIGGEFFRWAGETAG